MIRLQDISIKRKLTLIVMVASTVALLLVSGGFISYELVTFRQTMTDDLATQAQIIGNQSVAALVYDDPAAAAEILRALIAKKHIVEAGLYRNDRLFAQFPTHRVPPGLFPYTPESAGARFEKDHLVLFHEIHLDGELLGVVYLKSDLQEMHQRLQRYAGITLVMLVISLAVTFLLSSMLQRIISRPILYLAETARAVAVDKNYTVRAIKHGADELGQLIDGFNEMLAQIHAREVALQLAKDRLEKRVQERTKDLQQQLMRISLLNQITQLISERHDMESIFQVVLRQLEDHLSLDLGVVGLFDPQTESLNVAARRLRNPELPADLPLREGSVLALDRTGLHSCREGQTLLVPDTRKRQTELMQQLAEGGLLSTVAVPLLVQHTMFGVLLAARREADGFSGSDCEFLRTLSKHMALAAHQARLYGELEHAYNELRQTQQSIMQQERLKALGQMASGIAHDVNNALSPVVGFADLLVQNERGLTPNGVKYLNYIRTAGQDIAHIVARLREFYRRRDDRDALHELDLSALAEQVVDMTRPRWRDIPQSGGLTIEMQTHFTPELPAIVGNESEIREALTNLVLNAVDALPHGGNIRIRTSATRMENNSGNGEPPSWVTVEVSDNGIGMTEEIRQRCIEPFFSTKGSRGTGMGLSMVYGVVQRHEGSLEIESEPGKGSVFRLAFPARSLAASSAKAPEESLPRRPLRILYIDDEPLLRELLKELLRLDGHSVEVRDNGQDGIELFRQARQRDRPFDVVITDLGMPHLDGRQVARILKSESPDTPVILLTGWGTIIRDEGAEPAEVDAVLCKPPRSRELREILSRVTRAPSEPREAARLVAAGSA